MIETVSNTDVTLDGRTIGPVIIEMKSSVASNCRAVRRLSFLVVSIFLGSLSATAQEGSGLDIATMQQVFASCHTLVEYPDQRVQAMERGVLQSLENFNKQVRFTQNSKAMRELTIVSPAGLVLSWSEGAASTAKKNHFGCKWQLDLDLLRAPDSEQIFAAFNTNKEGSNDMWGYRLTDGEGSARSILQLEKRSASLNANGCRVMVRFELDEDARILEYTVVEIDGPEPCGGPSVLASVEELLP